MLTSLELRRVIREKFAWPGGYVMWGVCADGEDLCCDCMRKNYKQIARAREHPKVDTQWEVIGIELECNTDSGAVCSNCNETIKESYEDQEIREFVESLTAELT